ncbi:hypothetical protein KGY58_04705 [Candidatus Bipolaricaulota bacterium]|nr:hypothetical protein [Candidatus Bipolaricaulota bacterium]
MKIIKRYVGYLLTTLMVSLAPVLPAIAHTENQGWGHHMPMVVGFRGWGLMVLFWLAGFLLVALLSVTLIKTLRD